MSLTGISSSSPIPRTARQFNPAAGVGLGSGNERRVVLIGNKLSTGTETVETLGAVVANLQDIYNRAGRRSELAWMYRAYTAVDPDAPIYFVAVAEHASATAATRAFTFATNASVDTVLQIDTVKGRYTVSVLSGDTPAVQVAAAVAVLNADPDLPFTTAINGTPEILDVTTSNKGPRAKLWLNQLRFSYANPTNATTVTPAAVAGGANADSVANAITAVDTSEHTYHVVASTATSSVTASDGGVGQYINYINGSVAPIGNKSQMALFGLDATAAEATSVAQSSVANSPWGVYVQTKANDWVPSMVAAHVAAVKRSQEVNYAAANLTGWTNAPAQGQVFLIPDPTLKTNRPTTTTLTVMLNGGVTPIGFKPDGTPYIVRQVTGYSWVGSSTVLDFRAREGHIPSVLFKFWEDFFSLLVTQNQPNVAADPPPAVKPVRGFLYPRTVRAMANRLIEDMCGPYQDQKALLDPSVVEAMKKATTVALTTAGFELNVSIVPVRHLLFKDTIINQTGTGY